MSHCNEMICQHVTLSGYAERPKVADAMIEAPGAALSSSPYYVAEMAGARGGNRNIFGRMYLSISTYSMALTPINHCSSACSIVLKSLKYSAPFYEAPIRHESCQTTPIFSRQALFLYRVSHRDLGLVPLYERRSQNLHCATCYTSLC